MVSFPLAINLNNLNGRLFQVTCVYFSSMCTHMWPLCVLVEARGEHQVPGARVGGGCELQCGYWHLELWSSRGAARAPDSFRPFLVCVCVCLLRSSLFRMSSVTLFAVQISSSRQVPNNSMNPLLSTGASCVSNCSSVTHSSTFMLIDHVCQSSIPSFNILQKCQHSSQ